MRLPKQKRHPHHAAPSRASPKKGAATRSRRATIGAAPLPRSRLEALFDVEDEVKKNGIGDPVSPQDIAGSASPHAHKPSKGHTQPIVKPVIASARMHRRVSEARARARSSAHVDTITGPLSTSVPLSDALATGPLSTSVVLNDTPVTGPLSTSAPINETPVQVPVTDTISTTEDKQELTLNGKPVDVEAPLPESRSLQSCCTQAAPKPPCLVSTTSSPDLFMAKKLVGKRFRSKDASRRKKQRSTKAKRKCTFVSSDTHF